MTPASFGSPPVGIARMKQALSLDSAPADYSCHLEQPIAEISIRLYAE